MYCDFPGVSAAMLIINFVLVQVLAHILVKDHAIIKHF